jgi:protein-ribulosamine 3-kinase
MSPSVDPAILRALSLDSSTAKIASHGGSGFASTFRISTTTTTPPKSFFVKTSRGSDAAVMFEGEHASLNAIHFALPSLCPQSFGWGKMEQGNSYFLMTEFLDLGGRRSSKSGAGGRGMSLAQKLAKLHTTPAPIPEGYDSPQFGFPVTTCCGDTPQPNTFTSSWPDFFAQNRLLFILKRGESRNGADPEIRRLVENSASTVVPRLLGPGHLGGSKGITPVVVHGDLWSGNHSTGTFLGRDDQSGVEDVVYDPSACYAHSEYELGIMRMFGGFGSGFMEDYHKLVPKTEPVEEYEDRVKLYEVYHHLNHWAIFGGGYRGGAVSILKGLVKRYGADG